MIRSLLTRLAAASALAVSLLAQPADPAAMAQQGAPPALSLSGTTLPADQVTTVTVTGRDYLVPPHAPGTEVFGGVYVFFGWVAEPNHFGPSIRNSSNSDGTFGTTYAYPGDGGDPSTRGDLGGAMRFVSFTSGGESGSATDYHMDRDGNWSTTLHIFGATFATSDPVTGETRAYDCTQVQCGVFTIGAHGNASATNEKFTPVNFTGTAPSSPLEGAPLPSGGDAGSPAGGGAAPGTSASSSDDASGAVTPSAGNNAPSDGSEIPTTEGQDSPLGDDPVVVEHNGTGSGASHDAEPLALEVSHVRATGSGNGPLVAAGLVSVVSATVTARWWRHTRRRRAAPIST